MRHILGALVALLCSVAQAQPVTFIADPVGVVPAGWTCGVTGNGQPRWAITADATAPPAGKVLTQSGRGDFPWCVRAGVALADGFVEVRFKPTAGREDQAGGVVWRWKDGDHYYIARANALENNVALYYIERGSRRTLKYVDAPVGSGAWHRLCVAFAGRHATVWLDGKRVIDFDDEHISGPGAVGVWTKADSVTSFVDFSYGAVRP